MTVSKRNQSAAISDSRQLTEFSFSDTKKIHSIVIDDQPWFVARNVLNILELKDTTSTIAKLDEDEKLTKKLSVSGQGREVVLINESGLYNLIFRSNKPEAKAFRKWVTAVVLPEIRKNGLYNTPNTPLLDADLALLLAGLNHVKIDKIRWWPIRETLRRLNYNMKSPGSGVYRRFMNVEPECFVSINGRLMVEEDWVKRQLHLRGLKERRVVINLKGGKI